MSDNRNTFSYTVSVEKVYPRNDPSRDPAFKVNDNAMSPGIMLCSLYTARREEMDGFLHGRYGIRCATTWDLPEPPARRVWTINIALGYGQPIACLLSDDPALAPPEVEPPVVAREVSFDVVLDFVKRTGHARLGDYRPTLFNYTLWRMSGHEVLCDLLRRRTDPSGWTWDKRDDCDVLVDAAGQDRFTVAR
jgi:hypothetical protein